jgi:predicted DNA-binding transcriptional regulator AlpA
MPKAKTTSRNKTIHDAETDERIVAEDELLERIPLDRTTIWRMEREGRFPKSIRLTAARKGWRWSAILAWLTDREQNPVASRTYFRKPKKADAEAESR